MAKWNWGGKPEFDCVCLDTGRLATISDDGESGSVDCPFCEMFRDSRHPPDGRDVKQARGDSPSGGGAEGNRPAPFYFWLGIQAEGRE